MTRGEICSRDLVELRLSRIQRLAPDLHAYLDLHAEQALTAADGLRRAGVRLGPLHGVTVAVTVRTSGEGSSVDRCLGTTGVNVVLARAQAELIAHRWTATRVLAAPRDLTTGTLTLTPAPGQHRRSPPVRPGDETGTLEEVVTLKCSGAPEFRSVAASHLAVDI